MDDHLAHDMADLLVKAWRSMELGGLIVTLVATGLGAWAGGAAAFRGERKKREADRRQEEAIAIDQVLFILVRFHMEAASLMREFVAPIEAEPLKMISLRPAFNSGSEFVRIDTFALGFLHAMSDKEVLFRLMKHDLVFRNIATLVGERTRMFQEWVVPLSEKYPVMTAAGRQGFNVGAVANDLSLRQRKEMKGVSQELSQLVKHELQELPKTQEMLSNIYMEMFGRRPVYLVVENPLVEATVSPKRRE